VERSGRGLYKKRICRYCFFGDAEYRMKVNEHLPVTARAQLSALQTGVEEGYDG